MAFKNTDVVIAEIIETGETGQRIVISSEFANFIRFFYGMVEENNPGYLMVDDVETFDPLPPNLRQQIDLQVRLQSPSILNPALVDKFARLRLGTVLKDSDSSVSTYAEISADTTLIPSSEILLGPLGLPLLGAWDTTHWNPVFSFTGGGGGATITKNTAKYLKVGRHVRAFLDVTLVNIGTGVGTLQFTPPFAHVNDNFYGNGRESAVTGVSLQVTSGNPNTAMQILQYNNGAFLTNGWRAQISLDYESAS